MNANKILEIISKQWADTKDIKELAHVGRDKAMKIKKVIQDDLKNNRNWLLPNDRLIPMEELVKYLHININYLKKVRDKDE